MSNKRRRSIDVDVSYVEELESIAKKLNISTPTGVAVKIVVGKVSGFGKEPEKRKEYRGISMTEALWLAVRGRGEAHGGTGAAMHKILSGALPPLNAQEIAEGERLAREREAGRGNVVIKDGIESADGFSGNSIGIPSVSVQLKETPITRARKDLSAGEPLGPKDIRESIAKDMNVDDESYGGYFQF